jgi:hypothetical protein
MIPHVPKGILRVPKRIPRKDFCGGPDPHGFLRE